MSSNNCLVLKYDNINKYRAKNVYGEYGIGVLNYSVDAAAQDKAKVNKNFLKNESILANTDHFKLLSSKDPSLYLHTNLINIIVNNPINNNTQILIERFLYDQFEKILADNAGHSNKIGLGVDASKFTGGFKSYCLDKYPQMKIYIKNLRDTLNKKSSLNKDVNELKSQRDKHDYYLKLILNNIKDEKIMNCMFYSIFKVVCFNNMIQLKESERANIRTDAISTTNINIYMGKYLTNMYYKKIYEEYINTISNSNVKVEGSNEPLDLKEFKISLLGEDQNSILKDDRFFLHVGSKLLDILLISDLLEIAVYKSNATNSQSVLICSKEIVRLLVRRNPICILPINLPMIVKPIPYSTYKSLAGYLLNGKDYESPLFTEKLSYSIPSEVDEKNILLPVINNMMNTPFKVNKVLLKYLVENNHLHNLLIDPNHNHELENKSTRTKYEEREFQSYLSKKILEQNILIIADIYSNVHEFYFPVKLDHRGRLYPAVPYFNYQSNELSKALILFSRPDSIKRTDSVAIEYLKAYGASCYGNGLNKKSYNTRVEWVDKNWTEIINYENGSLFKNADDKFLFLSFCIEMKRFNDFLDNENQDEFKTYLPVQLDGTCNGFQHLALLSNETDLFEPLNLSVSSKKEDPKDLYSHILNSLNVYLEEERQKIKDKGDEKYKAYTRLLEIGLSRKEIKSSIMNKPYNAKDRTLVQYVKDSLKLHRTEIIKITDKKGNIKDIQIGWYKVDKSLNNNCINHKDMDLLIECINKIIYVDYRNILLLTKYFQDMARILNKLKLPIIWRLPTGLKISQKYMSKRSIKIEPFTFIDNSITLTITDKIKIDKNKQMSALMPNLVHSLDATALILLYNSFYSSMDKTQNVNFYSVHDCYGVTAKYVDTLIDNLRTVYISIYSEKRYIEKFDEDIILNIIQLFGENNCTFSTTERIIHIKDNENIKLPDISAFLQKTNKDLTYERLSKAIYFIN